MNPGEKSIGNLYSLNGNPEIVAATGSTLLYQGDDGIWAKANDGHITSKQVKKKGIKTAMEVFHDKMIESFATKDCDIYVDYSMNTGSPGSVAGMIRQHGTTSDLGNGVTMASLKPSDMIAYIRPIIEATLEEAMVGVDRPWGRDSARKLFSMIRTNPTICNRGIMIFNIVIRDKYGSFVFRWDE